MAEYTCKGAHVIQARLWFDEQKGKGSFDALARTHGLLYTNEPAVNSWYPVAPLVKILAQSGQSVEQATRIVSLRNGQRDLNTIYKFFMKVAAPVRVLGFLPMLWKTYIRFGDLEIVENDKGRHLGTIAQIPREYVDWVCGGMRGFVAGAIEASGGKNGAVSITKRTEDPPGSGMFRMVYEARYT